MLIGLADGVLASLRARYTPQHTWKILLRIAFWHQWCVHVRCLMYMSDWKCSVVPHIKLYNLQPKAWYLNAGPIHCRIMLHLNWYCALIAFCYVYRLIWNLFCFFYFKSDRLSNVFQGRHFLLGLSLLNVVMNGGGLTECFHINWLHKWSKYAS